MKAAIYNPYWNTMGGGERYSLAFAESLAQKGYLVDIEWKEKKLLRKLEKRFGRKLTNIKVVDDIKRGDGYDICFWLSDGSIPLLRGRKNILHFQFPFKNVNGSSLLNKMKIFRVDNIICNSKFTKNFIDKEYSVNSVVLYPPVDVKNIKSKRKENLILYIGRFSELTQEKRQDILIKAFKKLQNKSNGGWKLVLAGGTEVGATKLLKKLKGMIRNSNVEIIESPSFEKIKELLGKAKIYWSATGYGIDERKEPQKVEHFGISLVEAMATGAVPVVYNAGGFKEIITNNENGFLWKKEVNLIKLTKRLIEEGKTLRKMSSISKKTAQKYSYEKFDKKVWRILS